MKKEEYRDDEIIKMYKKQLCEWLMISIINIHRWIANEINKLF